jgi:hypothetical protein
MVAQSTPEHRSGPNGPLLGSAATYIPPGDLRTLRHLKPPATEPRGGNIQSKPRRSHVRSPILRGELDAEIVDLYQKQGWSLREIGVRYSTAPLTVRQRLQVLGVPTRGPGGTAGPKTPLTRGEYDSQIAHLYREAHSLDEIARLFNSSRHEVRVRLRAMGVEEREPGAPVNSSSAKRRLLAYKLYTDPNVPMAEVCRQLGVSSPNAVYRLLPPDAPRRFPQKAVPKRRRQAQPTATEGA